MPKDVPLMYPVSDDDLQLLESYLDDGLADESAEALRLRLATEPELSAALRQLRDERTSRQTFFAAIDPTPLEVQSLGNAVHQGIEQRKRRQQYARWIGWSGSAAACAITGLMGGLWLRGGGSPLMEGMGAIETPTQIALPAGPVYPVELTDDAGHVLAVQRFTDPREAREFETDLKQLQQRRQQQQRNGVMLINDEF